MTQILVTALTNISEPRMFFLVYFSEISEIQLGETTPDPMLGALIMVAVHNTVTCTSTLTTLLKYS